MIKMLLHDIIKKHTDVCVGHQPIISYQQTELRGATSIAILVLEEFMREAFI